MAAWDDLNTDSTSPGPDGKTWLDYTLADRNAVARMLRTQLREETYQHGPYRKVKIPKRPGSDEKRTLLVANLQDRVVARAAKQVLEPFLNPQLDDHSFCRPRRSPQYALAYAQTYTEREERTVWISEDLRDCFDQVPKQRLLDILEHYLPGSEVRPLIEELVGVRKGLPQGSPLSLLLLNLYLHHVLDRPWREQHPAVPLLRYVDDLLLLCKPSDPVDQLYADLKQLIISAGFCPKHGFEQACFDIHQEPVDWLGYTMDAQPSKFRIRTALEHEDKEDTRANLDYLYHKLIRLHANSDAMSRFPAVLSGIIQYIGPALPDSDPQRIYQNLASVSRRAAFEELLDYETFLQRWRVAYGRWLNIRDLRVADEFNHLNKGPWGFAKPDYRVRTETECADDGELPFEVVSSSPG